MGRESGSEREALRQEAAHWVVRLDAAACSDADRAAFEAWRGQSAGHEVAFEREAAAWERLDRLRALKPVARAADADLLAPAHEKRRAWRAEAWAKAAAVVGAIGLVAAGLVSTSASTAYATGIGERRVIVLADDSRIELNTDSKVVVRYLAGFRDVRLVKGEALFTPARSGRPFVVRAAGAKLAAADAAQVAVRLKGDAAAVTVRDGSIEVDQKAGADARLSAGVAAVYGPTGGKLRRVSTAEIDRSLAWRQGAIALNGQTLEQAVGEFNRYNRQQIRIDDPTVSHLRLAGYFQSTEPRSFVAAVTNAFPVRSAQDEAGVIHLAAAR